MHHAIKNHILCEECGSDHINKAVKDFPFEYGLGDNHVSLSAPMPYYECKSCGLQWMAPEAEKIQTDVIAVHLKRVSGAEIRRIRQDADMTQEAFAKFAGVSIASLKRWEARHKIPSLMASQTLRNAMVHLREKATLSQKTVDNEKPLMRGRFRTIISEQKRLAARVYNIRVPFPSALQQAA